MKLVYPCILIPEEVGGYSVIFPDIGGGTQGETLEEALDMAQDLANLEVKCLIAEKAIPEPTPPEKVVVPENAFMTLIRVDTDDYRKS